MSRGIHVCAQYEEEDTCVRQGVSALVFNSIKVPYRALSRICASRTLRASLDTSYRVLAFCAMCIPPAIFFVEIFVREISLVPQAFLFSQSDFDEPFQRPPRSPYLVSLCNFYFYFSHTQILMSLSSGHPARRHLP